MNNKQLYKLTESGIQEIIKNKINREDLIAFLNKKLNEDSIDTYRDLLDLGSNVEVPSNFQIAMRDKYVYDMVLALLYEEALSIKNAKDIIDENPLIYKSIFEKMIILEYNLFSLDITETAEQPIEFNEKRYIRDYVVNIYYGNPELVSYKNLENVYAEIDSLNISIPDELKSLDTYFGKYSIIRLNNQEAHIEGDKVALYSFLINYNIENKEFIRKHYGLYNGYYIKKENGLEKKIYLSSLKDIPILYYGNYALSEDADFLNIREYLENYHTALIKRTINY